MAIQMWDDNDPSDLADEFRKLVKQDDAVCFIKCVDGSPVAFAQCQFRYDYVEGTDSSPVGYLEGVLLPKNIERTVW